jgi:DNA-binding NtrC family response regulator
MLWYMSLRISIVDDDAHTLFFVRRVINDSIPEAEVVCFNSPRQAFEYICKIGSDLLITDHGMGEMCGTELIVQLRAKGMSLPVIMISSDTSTRDEALAAGACEFLSKGELNKLPGLISSRLAHAQTAPGLRKMTQAFKSAATR